jgi:hypothetical protein
MLCATVFLDPRGFQKPTLEYGVLQGKDCYA